MLREGTHGSSEGNHADRRLLSAREVAALLGVHRVTVHRLASRGELKAVSISPRCVRYRLAEVEALIEERTRA